MKTGATLASESISLFDSRDRLLPFVAASIGRRKKIVKSVIAQRESPTNTTMVYSGGFDMVETVSYLFLFTYCEL